MAKRSHQYELVLHSRVIARHILLPGLEHVADVLVEVGELGDLLGVEVLLHAEVTVGVGHGQVQGVPVTQRDPGRLIRDRLDQTRSGKTDKTVADLRRLAATGDYRRHRGAGEGDEHLARLGCTGDRPVEAAGGVELGGDHGGGAGLGGL